MTKAENYRTFQLADGYHKFSIIPAEVKANNLNHRFAWIISTYRPDLGDSWYIDLDFFNNLIEATKDKIGASRIELVNISDDKEEPPEMVLFFDKDNNIIMIAMIEAWYLLGGPVPYSDSFTVAFFSKNDSKEMFLDLSKVIATQLNAENNGFYVQSKTPVKPGLLDKIKRLF